MSIMKISEAVELMQAEADRLNQECEYGQADGIALALDILERVTDWDN